MKKLPLGFLDEPDENSMPNISKIRNVLGFACGLAILISCMGLFGLLPFNYSFRRTRKSASAKKYWEPPYSKLFLITKELLVLWEYPLSRGFFQPIKFLKSHWLDGFNLLGLRCLS